MISPQAAAGDFFGLFGLDPVYELDREELEQRYHLLQQQLHPDRFVTASAQERRLSVQWAGLINEAYRVLGDPVERALHLLRRRRIEVPAEGTVDDPRLLMRHAEWRERLESLQQASDRNGLEALQKQLQEDFRQQQQAFASALVDGDAALARSCFYGMQFGNRLCQAVEQALSG